MPRTKSSDIRYRVLDRCLRKGGFSTVALMNEVNNQLEQEGYAAVTSLNTIRQDLDFIGSSYPSVSIESKKTGRRITYSYTDPDASIFRLPFTDDELAQLSQCMSILSRFQGTPQMDWMQSFTERCKLSLNIDIDGRKAVGFDECPYLRGKNHFAALLSAICNRTPLSIQYKSFVRGSEKTVILHPYFLKEYNKRWFLLGSEDGYPTISSLAFDRIVSLSPAEGIEYKENTEFDFEDDYFSDIVGVTKHLTKEPEKIRIHVASTLYPYIQTKPLHESQRLKCSDEKGVEIEIEVRPNHELEQLLLSYGEGLRVVSPPAFRDRIRERISASLKNYENAQNE